VPTVFVVIVNWNGGQDTVACLDSLSRQSLRDLHPIVVDNGSQDDSVAVLEAWAANSQLRPALIRNQENLGFSAGSNIGIRHALEAGADYVFLLNNDTVLAPDAVGTLVDFLEHHPDFAAATGQIRYAGRPVIWNCGGDLTWFGSRKYLYGEQPVDATPQSGWRQITFITGCAALFRASVFTEHGLLTERFFFGEEDYDYSLRMRRAGVRIACCFAAVIEHRVGSSIDRAAPPAALGRYYIYYLNRFIDMRDHYPPPIWWLWRWASLAFVIPRLKMSRGLSWRALSMLARRLLLDSARLDGVSKERFEVASRSGLESL
jgi:GT2 family glycosyltransferase